MKKLSSFLLQCFYWLASLSFVYVFIMAFFWNREKLLPLAVGFPLFFALLLGFCFFLRKNSAGLTALLENKRLRRCVVAGLILLYTLLVSFCSWQLMRDTTLEPWDIWVIRSSSAFVAEHPFSPTVQDIGYFQHYENNQFILVLLSLWFMLCRFLFGNQDYEFFANALNVIAISSSLIFTYLAAKNFFGLKSAFSTLVAWFFCLPFYAYAATYYTDTLALPFITLSAWLLSIFYKTRRLIFLVPAGLVMGLGCKMKGTLLVYTVAVLIWLFFLGELSLAKRITALALVVGFLFTATQGFSLFYEKSGLYGEHPTDKGGMAVPFTHWLMMGQNPDGPYVQSDVDFTMGIAGGYQERRRVCWDIFRGRVLSKGPVIFLIFTNRKVVETWGDGSYYSFFNLGYSEGYHPDSFLRRLIDRHDPVSKPFFLFCDIFHFSMLAALVGTLLQRLSEKKWVADGLFLFQLSLFGMFLFELFWEWRSRYLFVYIPLLLCILPLGISAWSQVLCRLYRAAKAKIGGKA